MRTPRDFWWTAESAQGGQTHEWRAQGGWARHLCSFPPLVSVCVVSKLSSIIIGKILMLEKSPVNLSPYRSLKPKNTQNRVFWPRRVITKIRGLLGKSPKSSKFMEITSWYMQIHVNKMAKSYKVHVCILHASTSPSLTHARPEYEGDKN